MVGFRGEIEHVKRWTGPPVSGVVTHIIGLLIEASGPQSVCIGELCYLYHHNGEKVPCEVIGFKNDTVLLMPLGDIAKITPGSEVFPTGHVHRVSVSESMCGRILDALGNPIDGKGPIIAERKNPVTTAPPSALQRKRITEIVSTGIKAIDGMCTVGQGQRMGIFSGSGVGKSVLLGMIARMSSSDINVIALIGERGREVREFIERDLGPEGLAHSVVVVATSDQAALLRAKGANVATAIAEYFRDKGRNVILIMDSITRYAMALREVGLTVGEPPTTKGYPPSVFAALPKLLERSGNSDKGSITGIYSILTEGDDVNDPVSDTVRSILDGHIVLSRKLASANHYPAIDVLNSLSRVMIDIVSDDVLRSAGKVRDYLQVYKEAEDLINIGAYVPGSNAKIDKAISLIEKIRNFLRQRGKEQIAYDETCALIQNIIETR